jgi:DNA-binding XRE family transcriptional regulator
MTLGDRAPIPSLPEPAERVRLRILFGVTQDELAAEMKVTRKSVYAWEHGISEPAGQRRERYSRLLAKWAQTETGITRIARPENPAEKTLTERNDATG